MPRNVVAPEMLQRRIDCAMGRRPCELRLTNVRMIDVVNGEVVDKFVGATTKAKLKEKFDALL